MLFKENKFLFSNYLDIKYLCVKKITMQHKEKQVKYLDPKNDLTFRKIFGEHPHLLISFLNSLLPLKEGQLIETIEYQDIELIPELPGFKRSMVDVRCTDNFKRKFILDNK
jgi:hypothetical protein